MADRAGNGYIFDGFKFPQAEPRSVSFQSDFRTCSCRWTKKELSREKFSSPDWRPLMKRWWRLLNKMRQSSEPWGSNWWKFKRRCIKISYKEMPMMREFANVTSNWLIKPSKKNWLGTDRLVRTTRFASWSKLMIESIKSSIFIVLTFRLEIAR